jgi:hypothetical protein
MADELGASRRGGRRRGLRIACGAFAVAACLLGVVTAPSGAASEPLTATAEISLRCTGATPEAESTMRSLGLSTMPVTMTQRAPATVAVGETARIEVSFAFELSDHLADGAKGVGIETVDLSGTAMPLRLVGPSGETSSTVVPPKAVVDARAAGAIDLGGATFDVPTAAPGAAAVVLGDATVSVRAAPKDLSFSASCTAPALPPLGYLFVVDPAAPKVGAHEASVTSDDRSGTVDVATGVQAPASSALGGWRVVRTFGEGTAEVDDDGLLSWSLADGSTGLDAVWETCAVPSTATTTTSSTTAPTSSTTTTASPAALAATAGDDTTSTTEPPTEPPADANETTTTAPVADPAAHCAQGVVQVRPKVSSGVLSATAESGSASAQGSAAPITFTG